MMFLCVILWFRLDKRRSRYGRLDKRLTIAEITLNKTIKKKKDFTPAPSPQLRASVPHIFAKSVAFFIVFLSFKKRILNSLN